MGLVRPLLQEVIGAGWDQADINNYVLYYNGRVEAALAVPAPALDMSMKRAINTIIQDQAASTGRRTGGGTRRGGRDWSSLHHLTQRDHLPENLQNLI